MSTPTETPGNDGSPAGPPPPNPVGAATRLAAAFIRYRRAIAATNERIRHAAGDGLKFPNFAALDSLDSLDSFDS